MGLAEDFARDAGMDPQDIGLSLAQRFAQDAAAGLADLNAQQPVGNDANLVFSSAFGGALGNAQDGGFGNAPQDVDQSAAEWARLRRMNGVDAVNGSYGGQVDMGASTDPFGNGAGRDLVDTQQPQDNRELLNASNLQADPGYYSVDNPVLLSRANQSADPDYYTSPPPAQPRTVFGSLGSGASGRREYSTQYAGLGTTLPRPFLSPGASTCRLVKAVPSGSTTWARCSMTQGALLGC